MNAEKLAFYIKNPAHLYQITYTELKSLVLQYPYCQNLRYLLLKKSILENHPEREQNLRLAATFSADRNFLYQQIKAGDSYVSEADSFLLKEEYLELKELRPAAENEDSISLQNKEQFIPAKVEPLVIEDKMALEASSPEVLETTELAPNSEMANDLYLEQEELSDFLDDIEEEEFEDITDEIEDHFEKDLADLEIVRTVLAPEEAPPQEPLPFENKMENTNNEEDEAISIEDLIMLDSLSPLERLEKIEEKTQIDQPADDSTTEEQTEGMKKKVFDFDEIDALIQKTKKEVPLEITNEKELALKENAKKEPVSKSSFGSWLKQFQAAEEKEKKEETLNKKDSKKVKDKKAKAGKSKSDKTKSKTVQAKKAIAPKKKKGKKSKGKSANAPEDKSSKPKEVIKKSVQENEAIASETLADLLVKQENYSKAIKMYEKLSLIFPEKSGYFAEQIKKLKNL